MKRQNVIESFQNDLLKIIAQYAPSVNIQELNRFIIIRLKGDKVCLLISFKGVRFLGLTRLRRLRCV